jgi:hypothetical protein
VRTSLGLDLLHSLVVCDFIILVTQSDVLLGNALGGLETAFNTQNSISRFTFNRNGVTARHLNCDFISFLSDKVNIIRTSLLLDVLKRLIIMNFSTIQVQVNENVLNMFLF